MGTISQDELIGHARARGATVIESGGAVVIVLATGAGDAGAELVPLARAAVVAATTERVVREAIAAGELPAFGRRRDRAVKRRDLDAWIEARRVRIDEGPDDDKIEKRMRRIERGREKAER